MQKPTSLFQLEEVLRQDDEQGASAFSEETDGLAICLEGIVLFVSMFRCGVVEMEAVPQLLVAEGCLEVMEAEREASGA